MDEWSDVDLYRVTELFGKHPNLWDREHEDYHNLQERYHSYFQILEGLCMPNASVSDVLSILRELRCAYVSNLREMQVDVHWKNERLSGGNGGRMVRPVAKWFWVMHGFLYDHLDADERLTEYPDPNINPSTQPDVLSSTCACEPVDIGPKKGGTWSKDDPRLVHQERMTLDEKKWDKVDEENEVARGNGEFSVTSASHKGEILFIRAPRELASIRMNTVYEFPDRRMGVPSKMLSEDEDQYNTCNGNVEDRGEMVDENVNRRKCCWKDKGACLIAETHGIDGKKS
ncbi:uncharacterized protein LOC107042902 [Diachasma alloeum]|uniref:uncharacterized protein LOC107042902 n=1 Tax=Diachasma alloeum TaxID=454923 RepID=UPI000738165A|nr:uncharacterized protein LOC107042902 [Diachasma alloeum]